MTQIYLKSLNNEEILLHDNIINLSKIIYDIIPDIVSEYNTSNKKQTILIPFDTSIIHKIIEFCNYYNQHITNSISGYNEWYSKYFNMNINELAVLCKAANYLHIEPLIELIIVKLANILNHSSEELRNIYSIEINSQTYEEQLFKFK